MEANLKAIIYRLLKPRGRILYFPKYERKDLVYYVIIALALLRPIGFVLNSRVINAIGASTCISPLPTVFSNPGGIEAFSSRYLIVYSASDTVQDTVLITPAMFGKLPRSYPFRNVVSLTFGYFPLLPQSMSTALLQQMFFREKILQEMGIPACEKYTLINRTGHGMEKQEWKINVVSSGN